MNIFNSSHPPPEISGCAQTPGQCLGPGNGRLPISTTTPGSIKPALHGGFQATNHSDLDTDAAGFSGKLPPLYLFAQFVLMK